MPENSLLSGLLVLDLAAEPGRQAARILGDLGARVVRLATPAGGAGEGPCREAAWDAGKERASPADLDDLLAAADVVLWR